MPGGDDGGRRRLDARRLYRAGDDAVFSIRPTAPSAAGSHLYLTGPGPVAAAGFEKVCLNDETHCEWPRYGLIDCASLSPTS